MKKYNFTKALKKYWKRIKWSNIGFRTKGARIVFVCILISLLIPVVLFYFFSSDPTGEEAMLFWFVLVVGFAIAFLVAILVDIALCHRKEKQRAKDLKREI